MGYPSAPGDAYDRLFALIRELQLRLSELERPDGSQVQSILVKLQEAIDGLIGATDITIPGTLTAGGVLAGNVTGTNVFAQSVSTLITATRVAVWGRTSDGYLATASSSERYKTNIRPADIDPLKVLAIEPVYYQWIELVEDRERRANLPLDDPEYMADRHVGTEVGMIAERLHEAGLWEFVVYLRNPDDSLMLDTETGQPIPEGIHYSNWGIALQVVARYLHSEHQKLRAEFEDFRTEVLARLP